MARRVPLVEGSLRWLGVALVAGAILVASVTRPASVGQALGPLGIAGLDKWLHALAYATLAITLAYALAEYDPTVTALAIFAAAMAFGLGVELLQATIPYRDFSWLDLLANGLGTLLVATAWRVVAARLRFRRRPVITDS